MYAGCTIFEHSWGFLVAIVWNFNLVLESWQNSFIIIIIIIIIIVIIIIIIIVVIIYFIYFFFGQEDYLL